VGVASVGKAETEWLRIFKTLGVIILGFQEFDKTHGLGDGSRLEHS